ncbi:hypothetical protein HELRODRAFT_163607 [Helobdella robusta]|uniref:Uncharacterized protein n=1 Tax=Helobdella robusta TaxID=6412 RepID=T1EU99_HELRO|nr:hypothetical protein HELRODRAFT_163607 [Helobdella robusta]ESN96535.1 hypothetical protein HELRODRAFT_163607 [Helobdella robusta]
MFTIKQYRFFWHWLVFEVAQHWWFYDIGMNGTLLTIMSILGVKMWKFEDEFLNKYYLGSMKIMEKLGSNSFILYTTYTLKQNVREKRVQEDHENIFEKFVSMNASGDRQTLSDWSFNMVLGGTLNYNLQYGLTRKKIY